MFPDMELALERVRKAFEDPYGRVHGNGFVQLDVDDGIRVHIWGHPAVPTQKTPTPIHNHRFGFVSTTIVGRMVNVRYSLLRGATHDVYEPTVREGEDTVLRCTGEAVRPVGDHVEECFAGDCYHMPPGEFHETFVTGLTVTVMAKTDQTEAVPQVLCRSGQEPDNQFHRYAAQNIEASKQAVADAWALMEQEWCL